MREAEMHGCPGKQDDSRMRERDRCGEEWIAGRKIIRCAQETREAPKIIGGIDINAWSSGKTGQITDEGGREARLSGETG